MAPRAIKLHLATGRVRVLTPGQAAGITHPQRRELVQFIPAGTRTLADLYQALAEVEGLITTVARQYRFHPHSGLSEQGERALVQLVEHLGRTTTAPAVPAARTAFDTCTRVLYDHPGWDPASGRARTVRTDHQVWTASAELRLRPVGFGPDPVPVVDVYHPDTLGPDVPAPLREALRAQGPVRRLRTPDLWEALGAAIIRQVFRPDQARRMYRMFCEAYGAAVPGAPSVFPRPHMVLALTKADFSAVGMAFQRRPLLTAAEAYVEFGHKWAELPPQDLVVEVQSAPHIGPWTAKAAVADLTGDFSLYPYGDLAVRSRAARAASQVTWPGDEPSFAYRWGSLVPTPDQLSTLTVLTLALGETLGQGRL